MFTLFEKWLCTAKLFRVCWMCAMHMYFGEVRKEKTCAGGVGFIRLSHKCLVIVGPNTKTRNEGNRVGRPLFFDRSATLSAGSTTISRQGIGSQRVPAWRPVFCLFVLPDNAKRLWFSFFFSRDENLPSTPLRTFLSAHSGIPRTVEPPPSPPPHSSFLVQVIRGNIPRNLRRFCCTGLSPRGTFCFQMLFRIRLGKLHEILSDEERFMNKSYKKQIQYQLKVRTIGNAKCTLLLISLIDLYGLCKTNPQTFNWLVGKCE